MEFNSKLHDILNKDESAFKEIVIHRKEEQLASLQIKSFSTKFVDLVKSRIELNFNLLEMQFNQKTLLKALNGNRLMSFDYKNFNSGRSKLENFKGKYLFMDVWATWCETCIIEFPYIDNLKKVYANKNIEFVSVSVDKDYAAWKEYALKKELKGFQLFDSNGRNSDFMKSLLIRGIPRFILIGPDGEIINADAPKPSSPQLVKTLDELLKLQVIC